MSYHISSKPTAICVNCKNCKNISSTTFFKIPNEIYVCKLFYDINTVTGKKQLKFCSIINDNGLCIYFDPKPKPQEKENKPSIIFKLLKLIDRALSW